MVNDPEVGDVVVATKIIMDVDHVGRPYIHAVVDTPGVVVHLEEGGWPTVTWGLCGAGGTCDVPRDAISYATDDVLWVVNPPKKEE